jgi:methionyl-tRNA formyltransferase
VRVVLAGTPPAAVPSLEALASSRHELLAVLTRPDAPSGRGRRPARSAVATWADRRGIEVLQPDRPAGALERLADLAPDCCPVVAYGALLRADALALPPRGWVNLHFSLLPAWRGAAPVQRALMAGDEVTGASTFRIEEGLDTGPVYGRMTEAVHPDDTAGTLLERLATGGAGLLVATLDGIEDGTALPVPQPVDGVSLAPKVGVDEARVDWALPEHVVDRRIRGCTPAPGAWTTWRRERLKLLGVRLPDAGTAVPPLAAGEVCPGRDAVLVGTAGGPVLLVDVQPAGRRPMPAVDWARGVRPAPGERLA